MWNCSWKNLKAFCSCGLVLVLASQAALAEGTDELNLKLSDTLSSSRPRRKLSTITIPENDALVLRRADSTGPGGAGRSAEKVEDLQAAMLLVDINHQQLDETVLFLRAGEQLFAAREDLLQWRLRPPEGGALLYQGRPYFPLSSLPGVSYHLDERTQAVVFDVRPDQLTPSVFEQAPKAALMATRSAGGFFNYDLTAVQSAASTTRTAFTELGIFNRLGVGTSSFLIRDQGTKPQTTRLSTTWTADQPQNLSSLRVGDAYGKPGSWGRSVSFGGIQYATNFATQPRFLRFPYQMVAGEAVAPSTVDVFINNTRVLQQNVPPGPFSITDLPAVTGRGEMRLVVKDVLGREQVITQPFYSSDALLRAGLADFSYEMGVTRNSFGLASNRYAHLLGAATYRKGLTDHFTGEGRTELSRSHAAVGLGGNYLTETLGTLGGSAAFSQSGKGAGSLLMAGFDRQADVFSLGVHSQFATRGFAQLGLDPGQFAPKYISSVNLGIASHGLGTVGLAYVLQDNREQGKTRIATASYSIPLTNHALLNVVAFKSFAAASNAALNVAIAFPLGEQTSASVSQKMTRTGGASTREAFLQIQQSPPAGSGWGYHADASNANTQRAGLTLQTSVGTYGIDTANITGNTSTRLNAAGGVGILGGKAFLMREITDSFGVVKVGDYKDVRVYADNQLVGKTDGDGHALIPRLRPYDVNGITVEQQDLPLDAEIGALKIDAAPYFRSGVLVDFPIHTSHGATLNVLFENGEPVPSGALARIVGREEMFPVALNGEIYVTGLSDSNELEITWQGQSCRINAPMLPTKDPLPSLGTFICKGIHHERTDANPPVRP